MIHELRIYRMMPGKMAAAKERFETVVLRYWEKHGIRPLAFWTVLVGESNLDIYYILEWESLAEREERWPAFVEDPEFRREFVESEKDGVLVAQVTNTLLTPTRFSPLR